MRRCLNLYIRCLERNKNLSENTLEAYRRDISNYLDFIEKNYECFKPRDLESKYLNNYISKLVRDRMAKSTEKRKISAINGYYQYMLKEKYIDSSQIAKISTPKSDKKIPSFLTIDEVNALIKASIGDKPLDFRNYAFLELMYGSGLRVSELCMLNLGDVSLNNRQLKVTGKGNKERILPLNAETVKALREYINTYRFLLKPKDKQAMFINKNGDRISRVAIFKIIKELAYKAGIKKEISPHTLRHSFATHLIEGGADIMGVSQLLGHENVTTTEIYTHISKKTIFDKYDEIMEDTENEI